jgi:hypothetical protein
MAAVSAPFSLQWLGLVSSLLAMLHGAAQAQGVLGPPVATAPPNALAIAAANIGAKQCLPAVTALAERGLTGALSDDVLLDWDRKRPGNSAVFSLLGLEYANGNAAMSVTAVPEQDGSCSVSAERISVEPIACKRVAQRDLAGHEVTQLLVHMNVYTEAKEPGSSVTLLDAGTGCLVIRRYVKFSSRVQASGN